MEDYESFAIMRLAEMDRNLIAAAAENSHLRARIKVLEGEEVRLRSLLAQIIAAEETGVSAFVSERITLAAAYLDVVLKGDGVAVVDAKRQRQAALAALAGDNGDG